MSESDNQKKTSLVGEHKATPIVRPQTNISPSMSTVVNH